MKRHIEFFDIDHFENNYHRVKPAAGLENFIDFFWETKFDELLKEHPAGFSDALFPNIGYTYLVNLGTPFVMQAGTEKFNMKTDGFLSRHKAIECFHRPGNKLFGIKFKISPVILLKKINFAEYTGYIFPLSYLMDPKVIETVKAASSFPQRVTLLEKYFRGIVTQHTGSLRAVDIVKDILESCDKNNSFNRPVETLATQYGISIRTLQRYFETVTGIPTKNVLQIMRIRKATAHLAASPADFRSAKYGYYDHSHFSRHLKQFLQKETMSGLQPHLQLLNKMGRKD